MDRKKLSVDELQVETFATGDGAARFDVNAITTTYCVATGIDSTCRCCSTGCGA